MDTVFKSFLGPLALLLGISALVSIAQDPMVQKSLSVVFHGADGKPLVVSGNQIVAVHQSPYRGSKGLVCTRIYVTGSAKPIDVRGSVNEVLHQIGGDWVSVQAVASMLKLGEGVVPLLVDPKRIPSFGPSSYRRGDRSLTQIFVDGGFTFHITEPVPHLQSLLVGS